MTRENAKKKLPIILAFVEGKQIQRKCGFGDNWKDIEDLNNFLNSRSDIENYRIKPEPRKFELIMQNDLCCGVIDLSNKCKMTFHNDYILGRTHTIKVIEVIE